MEYKRFSDAVILRCDPGDEIVESITRLAKDEDIALASVSGLGAIKEFTAGVFNTSTKEYKSNSFSGAFEIVSLTGTITRRGGKPYLHLHMSAGDAEGRVFGGHLNRAVVSATSEIVIRVLPGSVGRKASDKIGLNLMEF